MRNGLRRAAASLSKACPPGMARSISRMKREPDGTLLVELGGNLQAARAAASCPAPGRPCRSARVTVNGHAVTTFTSGRP